MPKTCDQRFLRVDVKNENGNGERDEDSVVCTLETGTKAESQLSTEVLNICPSSVDSINIITVCPLLIGPVISL